MRTRLAVSLGGLAFAGACAVNEVICTEIGCNDGLTVQLEGAPQGPWTISVSAQGFSQAKDCAAGGNCGGLMFFEEFTPPAVNVTVTRGSNSVTYENLSPTPRTVQPNGARCDPICSQPFVIVQPPPP